MLVTHFLQLLLIFTYSDATINIEPQDNKNLVSCVTGIIKNHYKRNKITYVNINYDGSEILKILHALPVITITRESSQKIHTTNYQYVIPVGTYKDFSNHFINLIQDAFWNPYALFLIIVKTLDYKELKGIFDVLLNLHVNDVLVLNGTNDADLYTYNPFDNYNCGKKYNEIIKFGKCLKPNVHNLYPYKLVTGLKKCTFNATISHWPPYAMDQNIYSMLGTEQYVFKIISELENFELKYTGSVNGEEFSTISANMSASGYLYMLQEGQTDIIFGGMILVYSRALAFNYLCGHLPFIDDVRILVAKAGSVPYWKYLFLEFDTTVWIVLVLSFLGYFVLVVAILRVKDKASLFLVMIDFFFLHGSKRIFKSKGVFIMWVFFAYLISTYYQSSLVSIISKPIKNYQISTEEDLKDYDMEPCICTGLQKYMFELDLEKVTYEDGCNKLLDSIERVSKSDTKYTMSLSSIYLYNKHMFYDEQGDDLIYVFKRPMNNIIYAFYLYKGFPYHDKLNSHTIRLRENGLIDRYTRNLHEERLKKLLKVKKYNHTKTKGTKLLFPLYILFVGYVVATGLFILELFSKKKPNEVYAPKNIRRVR